MPMNQREIHIERKDKSMFNRDYLFSAEGAVFTQSLAHRPKIIQSPRGLAL